MSSFIRLALVVAAVMLATAQSAEAGPISTITGFNVPATGGFEQNGKLQHGTASACSPAKAAPGVDNSGTNFNYSDVGITSAINEPACVTVSFTTTDPSCWSNGLYSASYLGSFDPNNIQANYLGDSGASPNDPTPKTYSMTLPAGATLDTVFHMSVASTGCSSFDATWSSDRPWATARPRIYGHPFAGETLTAFDSWTTGTVTHQWRRCAADGSSCDDIPGATGTTYVVAPDDVGHALRMHSAATDGGGTSTSDSLPLLAGIQFDDITGQSLSGTDPTQKGRPPFGGLPGTCPAPKAGTAVDVAQNRFYDVFTRTNQSDSTLCEIVSLEATSSCTSGGPISAAYSTPFDPALVSRRYLSDGGLSAIQGVRTISYSFEVSAGASYDVVVASLNGGGATCPSYDLRLGATAPYPTAIPATVQGTAMEGQTLRAIPGSWTGSPVITMQWQRCFMDGSGCTDVPGAITDEYNLSSNDVGHAYRVRATATEGAGSASKLSAATAPVVAIPPAPFAGMALKRRTVSVRPNGVVNLTLSCPADATLACLGTDTLRLGKQKLGSRSFLIFNGEKAKLRFTLSKKVRKQLAKRKKLKATQTVVSRDARRLPVTTTAQLTLKFKKP